MKEEIKIHEKEFSPEQASKQACQLIAKHPATPVSIHWQRQDFPVQIARTLVGQSKCVLWVVATTKRLKLAEKEFSRAGLVVNALPKEADGKLDTKSNGKPTRLEKIRRHLIHGDQKKQWNSTDKFPQPPTATVTVVSLQRLENDRALERILEWNSCAVVFDHLGVLNHRLVEVELDETSGESPSIKTKSIRDDGKHPIPVFHEAQKPIIFIERDELALALLQADLKRRHSVATQLSTDFEVPRGLTTSVVGSDIVFSKYCTGAFLALLTSNKAVNVFGEGMIGGITPDKLSMEGGANFNAAVLKISAFADHVLKPDSEQTGLSSREVSAMRNRDFARTAVLSMSPTRANHDLLILCPTNRASSIAAYLNVGKRNLPDRPTKGWRDKDLGSGFEREMLTPMSDYLSILSNRNRGNRIKFLLQAEAEDSRVRKLARLGIALDTAVNRGDAFDLTLRPDMICGLSEEAGLAARLFEDLLSYAFEWTHDQPTKKQQNLKRRGEIFLRYVAFRKQRAQKLGAN